MVYGVGTWMTTHMADVTSCEDALVPGSFGSGVLPFTRTSHSNSCSSLLLDARVDHVDGIVGPADDAAIVVQHHHQRVCVQLVVVLVCSAVLLHRCVLRCWLVLIRQSWDTAWVTAGGWAWVRLPGVRLGRGCLVWGGLVGGGPVL